MQSVSSSTSSMPPTKTPSFIEKDVQQVLTSVVDKVVKAINPKPTKQRGASRRESHTVSFKVKVLKELLYTDKSQYAVAEMFKVNQSMVFKWLKDKNKIFQQAAVATKRNLFKQRSSRKYLALYERLFQVFKETRKKGHHVNFNWLWSRARNIYREEHGPNDVVKRHVIQTVFTPL